MILPIVAYGDPVLRTKAKDIPTDFPDLPQLIIDMYETMYRAHGVGLAAPQVGKSIRIFVVDSTPMTEEETKEPGLKRAFINPTIVKEEGEKWAFEEGCLSIPGIRGDVMRASDVTIHYWDQHGQEHTDVFTGMEARIIQHEYDHLEGKLFTDYLTPFRKQLIKGRLAKIQKGDVDANYRMRFPRK